MRVTDLTKQNAVIRNVATNSSRIQQLQEDMASGKRINRVSDDPVAATQVQDYRTRLSSLDRIKQNLQSNFVWLDRTDAELAHLGELLQRTKELLLAQSNATADGATRRVTAEEVQDIIENLINSGNAKINKVFIFSGSKTLTQPLVKNPGQQAAQVNTDQLPVDQRLFVNPAQLEGTFDGWSEHPYVVRITGEGPMGRAMFKVSDDAGKTWSAEKTLLPQIEVVNDAGLPSDKVRLRFKENQLNALNEPVNYPQGLEYRFTANPPVAYLGNDDKRMVISGDGIRLPLNVTDRDIFFRNPERAETVDIFPLMFSLKRALEDNDPKVLEQKLNEIDRAADQVLARRADVGSVRKEMEDQLNKSKDREFQNTKQMSDLEDLDFPGAVTEMNLADVRNKATLDTSGRLIQPSLLNFLR